MKNVNSALQLIGGKGKSAHVIYAIKHGTHEELTCTPADVIKLSESNAYSVDVIEACYRVAKDGASADRVLSVACSDGVARLALDVNGQPRAITYGEAAWFDRFIIPSLVHMETVACENALAPWLESVYSQASHGTVRRTWKYTVALEVSGGARTRRARGTRKRGRKH